MPDIPNQAPMSPEDRHLRDNVCCSVFWADVVLAAIQDGNKVILKGLYPPGGRAETGMQKCSGCHKWCPPNCSKGSLCCDCEAKRGYEWVTSPERKWMQPQLYNLWRAIAVPFRERVGEILRVCRQFGPALQTEDDLERVMSEVYGFDTIGKEDALPLPEETGNVFYPLGTGEEGVVCPEEWCSSEEGPRNRADDATYAESARLVLRRIKNCLRRGGAPDCALPLLGDDDQSLRKEIDYYHGKRPAVQPDTEDFSRADIHKYWIALGVIPSAADPDYRIRKKSSRPVDP